MEACRGCLNHAVPVECACDGLPAYTCLQIGARMLPSDRSAAERVISELEDLSTQPDEVCCKCTGPHASTQQEDSACPFKKTTLSLLSRNLLDAHLHRSGPFGNSQRSAHPVTEAYVRALDSEEEAAAGNDNQS